MAATGVRVENLTATVRALQKLGVEVQDLKDVFAGIAAEGARLASAAAPHRSGKLRASIRGNKAKNKAVVIAGRARVPYAGPMNYGWKKKNIRGTMFLQKADSQLSEIAPRMLEDGLQRVMGRNGF
jgi:hypothetical protein